MRTLLGTLVLITLIIAGWHTMILLPLKWLVVFFHEASHALATLLTGGEVKSLQIVPEQGGRVISAGGNRFIILSSGYLGSLLCGLVLFVITAYTQHDHFVTAGMGLLLLTITAFFADTLFSQLFGGITGVILCLSAYYLPAGANDFINRLIALTNMLYVPLDIYDDTLSRSHLNSDAAMLATEFGGSTWLWGGLWLLVSGVLIALSLRKVLLLERQ